MYKRIQGNAKIHLNVCEQMQKTYTNARKRMIMHINTQKLTRTQTYKLSRISYTRTKIHLYAYKNTQTYLKSIQTHVKRK